MKSDKVGLSTGFWRRARAPEAILSALLCSIGAGAQLELLKLPRERHEALLQRGYESLFQTGPEATEIAVERLREALRNEPASAYRWCDLGEALIELGRTEEARQCFKTAGLLAGESSRIFFRSTVSYFRLGNTTAAVSSSLRLLDLTERYDALLFGTWERMGIGVDEALSHGLAGCSRCGSGYLHHLLAREESEAAESVWLALNSEGQADDRLAIEYVDYLTSKRQFTKAGDQWAAHLGPRAGDYPKRNLLFNGDFEFESTGSRFDWKIDSSPRLKAERVSDKVHTGKWALQLSFQGGPNDPFPRVGQLAISEPGAFRLRAWVRSDYSGGHERMAFKIIDVEEPSRLDTTTQVVAGNGDWRLHEIVFEVGPETKLLDVQAIRRTGNDSGRAIRDTYWIDTVKLLKTSP